MIEETEPKPPTGICAGRTIQCSQRIREMRRVRKAGSRSLPSRGRVVEKFSCSALSCWNARRGCEHVTVSGLYWAALFEFGKRRDFEDYLGFKGKWLLVIAL